MSVDEEQQHSYDLSTSNQVMIESFRASFGEIFNSSVLAGRDMLIDGNNDIVTFETKIVVRKFRWNPRTQRWEKIISGSARNKKRSVAAKKREENMEESEVFAH